MGLRSVSGLRRRSLVLLVVVAVAVVGMEPLSAEAAGVSPLAWGSDSSGQLGDGGTDSNRPVPGAVSGLGFGRVTLAAGAFHNLAIKGDGSVVAWGGDSDGQLGDGGSNTNRSTPLTGTSRATQR